MKNKSNRFLGTALVMAFAATATQAATRTKSATGTDLTVSAAWDALPTSADIATWTTGSLGTGLTAASGVSWEGINISGALTNIGITGAGSITLGSSGITLTGNKTLTVGNDIVLSSSQAWSIADATANATTDAAFSGGISGAFGLTKSGAGTLALSGNNSYSGGTALSGGYLTVANSNALGSGTLTISGSANKVSITDGLTISNPINITGYAGVSSNGLIQTSGTGTVTLTGPINISGTSGSGGTFGGANGGNGTLIITGAITSSYQISLRSGTGVFSGGGSYSAIRSVYGTIRLGATNGLSTSATLDVSDKFDPAGYNQTLVGLTGGGTIGSSSTATDSTLTTTGTSTYAGVIQDAIGVGTKKVNLTVNGGALTLSGNNSYSGVTTLQSGTLTANHTNALGSGNITFGGGTLQYTAASAGQDWATRIKNSGSAIALDTNSQNVTLAGILDSTNTGGLTKQGAGTLVLSASNDYTGATTLTSGTLQANHANALGSGNITFGGGVLQFTAASAGQDWATRIKNSGSAIALDTNSQDVTLAGILDSTNTGGLTKSGSGTLTLTGSNAYTGNTTVSGVGPLKIGNGTTDGDISSTSSVLIQYTSIEFNVVGNKTFSAPISSGIDTTFGTLTKSGAGTLTLTGNNSYAKTVVTAGVLRIENGLALGFTTDIGNASVELQLANNITIPTSRTFSNFSSTGNGTQVGLRNASGNNTIQSIINVGTGGGGLKVQSDSGLLTLAGINGTSNNRAITLQGAANGVITGGLTEGSGISGMTLTKSGAGTWTLSGSSSYTGTTSVNAGKLVVNGNVSTSSLTTVASGATIGGSGTVGALTVLEGGFVTPGNSPGILNTGNYTQAGTFTAEINGTTAGTLYDQINVTGAVDIAGGSLSTLFSTFTPINGNLLFILLNDGNDAVVGTYAGYAQNAIVSTYGGFDWKISYTANSAGNTFTGGNDIALMAVPEPNVAALLGGLGILALLRRRRTT